jgi:hypothetical protein
LRQTKEGLSMTVDIEAVNKAADNDVSGVKNASI